MIESLFGIAFGAVLAYIIQKLEKIEDMLNLLENKILIMETKIPKRRTDENMREP